ncbi:hypothetical protein QE429_000735 [Bacillus sp. SORGH_AS 510]|nr:hypothetical protein [Bacillus sp. SORGH_AS_0510]
MTGTMNKATLACLESMMGIITSKVTIWRVNEAYRLVSYLI